MDAPGAGLRVGLEPVCVLRGAGESFADTYRGRHVARVVRVQAVDVGYDAVSAPVDSVGALSVACGWLDAQAGTIWGVDVSMSRYDALARAVLLALAVCSDVSSSGGWMREDAPPVAPGDPDRPPPGTVLTERGSAPSLAAHFEKRYAGCRSDASRRLVLADALDALRAVRYSRRANIDLATKEGRLMVGRDPRSVSVVAYTYGYSRQHVYRLRAEAARFRPSAG